MTRAFRIGRIFGIDIEIDYTWFAIFLLLVSVLVGSAGPLGHGIAAIPPVARLAMAVFAALLFFASVLLHELSHSLVALRHGMKVTGITLFIFGGVSKLSDEPKSPGIEFRMAIAGPMTSFLLAGIFFGLSRVPAGGPLGAVGATMLVWLAVINGMLGIFNLLPGFPLDGGRVLRACLWHWMHSLDKATRIAAGSGRALGALMIFGGIFLFLRGGLFNGIWLAMIGWFLSNAAQSSYQQLVIRQALSGVPVSRVMTREVLSVPANGTLDEIIHDYVLVHHHPAYPVFDGDHLLGLVTLASIRGVAREQRSAITARQVVTPLSEERTIPADADVWAAMAKMAARGPGPLLVMTGESLVGVISHSDIVRLVRTRTALDDR